MIVFSILAIGAAILSLCAVTQSLYIFVVQTRKLDRIGEELKSLANQLEDSSRRRIEFQDKLANLDREVSAWNLVILADRHDFPKWTITCLPNLFVKSNTDSNHALVWQFVLQFIPETFEYKELDSFCRGEIVRIRMGERASNYVNKLAHRVEGARKSTPYVSRKAFAGTLNQAMNEFELYLRQQGDSNFAELVGKKRKEFFLAELSNPSWS